MSLEENDNTIGAMTGAIAGVYYGTEKIPSFWVEKLENGQYINISSIIGGKTNGN